MASPLQTAKRSVDLKKGSGLGRSRIRRDPPPVVKEKAVVDPEERDQWAVAIGVVSFALAIVVIIFAFSSYSGWSPSQYTVAL